MAFDDDEIEQERRKAIRRNQNLDDEQLRQKAALRRILERGSLQDLLDELDVIHKGEETTEGKALIAHFRRVRGL